MFYFHQTRKPDFKNIKKIDYNAYWDSRGFALRTKLMERERIFFNLIPQDSRVLDVGCGNSRLLYELKTKKNCLVLGVDISPLVTEGLSKLGIKSRAADIQSADFRVDGHYDYIISSETLEHLASPEDLLGKLCAHTNYFVLSVPNSAFYRYRISLMFFGRFFTQWKYYPNEHLRYWSHTDFLDWLEALNLKVVKYKASNGFELKDLWPNLFGHQICYLAEIRK